MQMKTRAIVGRLAPPYPIAQLRESLYACSVTPANSIFAL